MNPAASPRKTEQLRPLQVRQLLASLFVRTSVRCASNTPREALNEVPEIRAFGTPDDC